MVCCFLLSTAADDDELMMKMINATVTIAVTATNDNS